MIQFQLKIHTAFELDLCVVINSRRGAPCSRRDNSLVLRTITKTVNTSRESGPRSNVHSYRANSLLLAVAYYHCMGPAVP